MIGSLARQSPVAVEEVVDWASEASQLYRFNRELLQSSVENIPQGISVIDKELRLVAWNRRYLEIFAYPEGLIRAGITVEEILRFNIGECLGDTSICTHCAQFSHSRGINEQCTQR